MKVSQMPYEHIPLEELKSGMESIIAGVRSAKTVEEVLAQRERYLKLNTRLRTASSLCEIR